MCEELGPNTDYLQQFVEEAGATELCSASELTGSAHIST